MNNDILSFADLQEMHEFQMSGDGVVAPPVRKVNKGHVYEHTNNNKHKPLNNSYLLKLKYKRSTVAQQRGNNPPWYLNFILTISLRHISILIQNIVYKAG